MVSCVPYAVPAVGRHVQCLRIYVYYRPNHAPNTESAVVACVRPSRQSGDCLRGRPLRAPALSVMVCLACGAGTAHGCTRRVGGTSAHPHSATACRVRRSIAHPGAYAVAWLGSEYLPQALRLASAPVFAIPPFAKAMAPWLMHLVRPRYMSGIPFACCGASAP